MRRLAILAVLIVVVAVLVAPAAAADGRPIKGTQDLDFNLGVVTGEGAAPDVSWVGTFDIKGATYDVAYFPTAPLTTVGWWTLFQEDLKVYGSLDYEFTDGVLTTFDEGEVILTMSEQGLCSPKMKCHSMGEVTEVNGSADSQGTFADVAVGDWVDWLGAYANPEGTEFTMVYRIFPLG